MAEIRISKLLKKYNIGLQDLVAFVNGKGLQVDEDPNAKIPEEYEAEIAKKFGSDLEALKQAEKVDIKMNEIIEKSSKKPQEGEEDDSEPVRETVIRTNTLSSKPSVKSEEAAPKLEESAPKAAEPAPEAKKPAPKAEKPAPKAEKPKEDAPKEDEPAFKVLGKIDLSPKPKKKAQESAKAAPAASVAPEAPVVVETPAPAVPAASAEAPVSAPQASASAPQAPKAEASAHVESAPAVPAAPAEPESTLKVVGKIDLSQFDKKPAKKHERISKNSQKVDVTKVAAQDRPRQGKNQQTQNAPGSGKRHRDRERFKPALTEAEQEEMQKEIQKQVKETYARMNEGKKANFGAKYRKEKREAAAAKTQEEMEQMAADQKNLKVTEFVTANDLATLMNISVNQIIGACMTLGLMVSINQRLDAETIVLVAEEFGYKVEFVGAELQEESLAAQQEDKPEDLLPRPPIITVMGHVDHGKTSLLDSIRNTNVIAGEAGGITQHIGAYNVKLADGRRITFLDTPGHEAFTAMRARGAQLTDLAIIIVAADDAVMPQTVEAINHAQAAGVPMVFAINKIDREGANPDTIRRQLSEMNILVEDWGGKYQCQEISAKKGLNVDKLLEKVLLEADLLELKANPNKPALGAIVESSLDKGRGYLATVLVQEGTMHQGDIILCGSYYGRVKSMFNERGQKVTEAGPSTPVSILGLNGAPAAGEKFVVMLDEKEAKSIAAKREQLLRIQGIKTQKHMTLDEIGRRIAIGNFKELNIIVKGDVDGSVEALSDSLIKLSTEQVKVNVIHKAVGGISESDVLLAEASDAVIIGFQVRPTVDARKAADKEGIEIRLYSVIYDAINEVKDGIEGMLEPEKKEEVLGTAEVKQTFKISKVGTIAGCIVRDGKIPSKSQVRLIRDGIVIYSGELGSLQIAKDQVKEVVSGKECGMGIAGYNDIKEGDMIEAFTIVEIKRTL